MSALMKMLGVDKLLDGVDINSLTAQFEAKLREDANTAHAIRQIAADIAEIKRHLGIESDRLELVDITYRDQE